MTNTAIKLFPLNEYAWCLGNTKALMKVAFAHVRMRVDGIESSPFKNLPGEKHIDWDEPKIQTWLGERYQTAFTVSAWLNDLPVPGFIPLDRRAVQPEPEPEPQPQPKQPPTRPKLIEQKPPVEIAPPTNDNATKDGSADDDVATEAPDDDGDDDREGDKISIPDADRPCYKVFEANWTSVLEHGWLKAGVYWFGTKVKGDQVSNIFEPICSPLYVDAIASDENDGNYGRVLRFVNSKKKWRTWAMPMELLAGSGELLRAELFAMGCILNVDARSRFLKYVSETKPMRHVRCATQVGWAGNSFVLPAAVIGPAAINVIFQSGERGQAEYGQRGTLDGWRFEISARAVGNPVLMMSLSAAFVGPMLDKVGGESGGIHLVDNSSVGKSTAIKAAVSVWGGPRHLRSWNATANGMEGVAALFNDNLLPLDEISECAPHDINRIVYALANGVGKQRASRSGAARNVVRWRCFVISSGERMIATEMLNAGIKAKAGQLVRIIDLPVARQYGVWDDLHGMPNGGAFSDAIKAAVATHHGLAGVAFLERLTRDGRDWAERWKAALRLPVFHVDDDAGQDKRVAARFAMIALAGEVATEYGITGWPAGDATNAAATMFRAWQTHRKHGNKEPQQILEQLAGFIEKHGDSRFSENRRGEASPVVRDRAGWWENGYDEEGRIFWFNSDGLREALKGHDFERALDVLVEFGVLPSARARGERAQQKKIEGRNAKFYRIAAERLVFGNVV